MHHYQVRNAPSKSAIIRLIHRFQQQGSVVDLPRVGRPRPMRTPENRSRVEQSIGQDAATSTRRRPRELGIPRTSLQRLQKDLHMYPYKIQLVQEIKLRVTVWCGVTSEKIIGPYFFEDERGNAITVTGARYHEMLEPFVRPTVQDTAEVWWQQDGATAHTARQTMQLLRDMFGERLISRNADFNWPANSPDLTVPDFFLWGYLKNCVYSTKPRNIQELKENIRTEIRALEPDTLIRVMGNALERARACEAANGGWLMETNYYSEAKVWLHVSRAFADAA
ncbi:hypothetical protein X975_20872, partial [Stegodyphus mimosarum]